MNRPIRIGTRSSDLAMYQAELTASILKKHHIETEIIKIDSHGDIDLKQPIYAMGMSGVFTKSLDIALLNGKIDVAVHSLKDVPTQLPQGIINLAVLKRSFTGDILKYKGDVPQMEDVLTIGTGSIRRKAQWLNQYPHHQIEPLRGNVNTRLQKIEDNAHWTGAIFAKAGLHRLNLEGENYMDLEWMVPAPAQGAIVVACREEDADTQAIRSVLNDAHSEITSNIERDFMRTLEAGCSSPIGAIATVEGDQIRFKGLMISLDGQQKAEIDSLIPLSDSEGYGEKAAQELLKRDGDLIQQIKSDLDQL